MIQIENTNTYGWEPAIRGMRNPMNSWDKSDTFSCWEKEYCAGCLFATGEGHCDNFHGDIPIIGPNDLSLMKKLVNAGSDHSKFMRMLTVYCDLTAPLYWWKEYDTYKVGTVANSCSTMHKIHAKEFTLDDFSHEHLDHWSIVALEGVIRMLNHNREKFLETGDKTYWWQMIQLLPSSYNQKRTVELNYAVLRNMYHARKNHKLDEWHTFCEWVETLPYAEALICCTPNLTARM